MKMCRENVQIEGKSFLKLIFYRSDVMVSLTIELVSNASFNCYPNNSLSSLTSFLPQQILYQQLSNFTEGKLTFVDGRESSEEKRKIVPMIIDPGLYPSIVDIVVAMNNKIAERLGAQAFEYNGIYVSVDKITQKIAVQLPENQSAFIIQSSDLSHIFG